MGSVKANVNKPDIVCKEVSRISIPYVSTSKTSNTTRRIFDAIAIGAATSIIKIRRWELVQKYAVMHATVIAA